MRTKMNGLITATLMLTALTSLTMVSAVSPCFAKKHFTITNRQTTLSKRITAGQKSGELTLKEATSLKDDMSKIIDQESKMKAANGGKLSYADQNKLEKELNKISLHMDKKELSKRVSK